MANLSGRILPICQLDIKPPLRQHQPLVDQIHKILLLLALRPIGRFFPTGLQVASLHHSRVRADRDLCPRGGHSIHQTWLEQTSQETK